MNNISTINIDYMLSAIGDIIRRQKESLNMTVAQISEKSGVSVGVISDLINQRGRVPSLTNFMKLAVVLKLPEDMFTSLIQGKIEQVQKANNCTREDVENVLLKYGLKKDTIPMIMVQIDALLEHQCSNRIKRI